MTDILTTASLEVLNGPLAGKSFPLEEETLIGRCDEDSANCRCQLRLPDDRVSRQHARIIRRNGGYVIQDLDSTNGTLLNSRPLTPKAFYALREGSNLQLGGVHLRFRPASPGRQEPPSPAPWESEIGDNEEAFDLALIAGESPAQHQPSCASLKLIDAKGSKPDLSMAIDAREALRLLKANLREDHAAASDVQRRLRALAQVSIGLGEQNSREDLLAKVMDFIFDIFPAAEHAYGLLCDEADNCAESLKPVVAMSRRARSVEVILSRAIVSEVISRQQAILSSDAQSDQRFDSHESIIGLGIRSVMCVPLLHGEEVLGLIQVENNRSSHSFDREDLQILSGIGVQAAMALKNLGLVEDIQQLFEGFVTASVHAIEARDPSTAGHSFRVAEYSQRLAEAVGRSDLPALRDVNFSREQMDELRYAALLHDFGKVGVREHVLTKSHKLYPRQFELMQARFQYARASMERHAYRKLLDEVEAEFLGAEEFKARRRRLERHLAQEARRMRKFMDLINEANEPAVSHQPISPALKEVVDYCFPGEDGEFLPLLSEFEMEALTLARGSLTPDERLEIESHVSHTHAFLQHIPWTKSLAGVPEIAYTHHEKLDGSGYPRGLSREQIPLQARIMTVTDIYDALTAGDRPYKQSLPEELALDILREEAEQGKVEPDLVAIFIDSNAYRLLPER